MSLYTVVLPPKQKETYSRKDAFPLGTTFVSVYNVIKYGAETFIKTSGFPLWEFCFVETQSHCETLGNINFMCGPDWPGVHRNLPISAFQVLG